MCCQISVMKHTSLQKTPTWSVLLPLLSTCLPYHIHWKNNTPTSASTLPNCHLCDTIECVKGCCQIPHCIFCWGSIAFMEKFLLCQVSEFTVFHICITYEKYPFEIVVVDQCFGGSSRCFFTPGKHKMCLCQSTLSFKECICVDIKL